MIGQIPSEVKQGVIDALNGETNDQAFLTGFQFVGGGCINFAGKLETSKGTFFLKWNERNRYPLMLNTEARGLALLRAGTKDLIPETYAAKETDNFQFLILEWITPSARSREFNQTLAQELSTLHRNSNSTFGLSYSNYIGSLVQSNAPLSSWVEFFIEERLVPQMEKCLRSGAFTKSYSGLFDSLFQKLPGLLPEERPALLHGDLWSGNVISNSAGLPRLVDPAVYYGHREVDLAIMKLFGGFDESFYSLYHDYYSLESGWVSRTDIYNLYPLLVHVNLFGHSYVPQVVSILTKFR